MTPDLADETINPELSRIERVCDAWRGCLREVDECLFYIGEAAKRGRAPAEFRVAKYLEHVRLVSGYEAQMSAAGVQFTRRAA